MSKSMGEFLAILRKANGYTQQEVAEKLNISNRTLSSWETDRTTPDILLLPAIADLYGVTVDELLRGERTEKSNGAEISEKAQRAARKHRFGKLSAKGMLLTGFGCLGGLIFVLAFLLWLFTSSPMWLNILLMVLGLCGVAACVVLVFYFNYGARLADGIVLSEDLTEDKKAYALALKHRTARFLLFNALPFLIGTALIFVIFAIANPSDYEIMENVTVLVRQAYLTAIGVNAAIVVILLAASLIYGNANFNKLANERQTAIHKSNKKLVGKICGFGFIPLIMLIITAVLFYCLANKTITIYKTENFDDFRTYMQTLVIDDNTFPTNLEMGEYQLDMPDSLEYDVEYDVGHGIKACMRNNNDTRRLVLQNKMPDGNYMVIAECNIVGFEVDGEYKDVALIRNCYLSGGEWHYGIFFTSNSLYVASCHDGSYLYYKIMNLYYTSALAYGAALIVAAAVAACGIVYAKKHKRQDFGF